MMLQLFVNSLVMDQRVNALLILVLIVCFKILMCYVSIGAIPTLWTGLSTVPVFLDNVNCHSSETTLLNCSHVKKGYVGYLCFPGGYAGVKCREEQLRVKNVNATTVDAPHYAKPTVMISWKLYSGAPHSQSSFRVECFSQQHTEFSLSVTNETLTEISVGGLLSFTSYNCCVSAIYYEIYETEERCTLTEMLPSDLFTTTAPNQTLNQPFTTSTSTQMNLSMIPASIGSEKVVSSDLNMRASIIVGVLGSVIVVLLLLLAICGGALLFLLRSRSIITKR